MHRSGKSQGSPAPHPDPKVDAFRPYIEKAVTALKEAGLTVIESWMDPCDPIDATIRLGGWALVWDEWDGWRLGVFVSGRQGVRTVLHDTVRFEGGPRLAVVELAQRVRDFTRGSVEQITGAALAEAAVR